MVVSSAKSPHHDYVHDHNTSGVAASIGSLLPEQNRIPGLPDDGPVAFPYLASPAIRTLSSHAIPGDMSLRPITSPTSQRQSSNHVPVAQPEPSSQKPIFFSNYSKSKPSDMQLPIRKSSKNIRNLMLAPKSDDNASERLSRLFPAPPPQSHLSSDHSSPLSPSPGSSRLDSLIMSFPAPSDKTNALTPLTCPASATSEHPDKPRLSVLTSGMIQSRARGVTLSAYTSDAVLAHLKPTTSIPDLKTAGDAQHSRLSSAYKPERSPTGPEPSSALQREPLTPWRESMGARGSLRSIQSIWTNGSTTTYDSFSHNDLSEVDVDRSSILGSFEMPTRPSTALASPDDAPTVEDTIDLYAALEVDNDFERQAKSDIIQAEGLMYINLNGQYTDLEIPSQLVQSSTSSPPSPPLPSDTNDTPIKPCSEASPSTSASVSTSPTHYTMPPYAEHDISRNHLLLPTHMPVREAAGPGEAQNGPLAKPTQDMLPKSQPVSRDIYGFKKVSHTVTLEEYDKWNAEYDVYLDRRRKKWAVLMKQYGMTTVNPVRFPPRSDKVKRYIRKGIPPEWRGAAWFWYAGGPDWLAREHGLYQKLVAKAQAGELSETDKDLIERDLHRTFPDNIRFKPDPEQHSSHAQFPGKAIGPIGRSSIREPKILGALRRLLQAFAIHNPSIGYCQSLNFLAGLLLIFLDEDEEKSFILLCILTNIHLPGIHAKFLEANVDVGVLMTCIQEGMPAVWTKINDVEDHSNAASTRQSNPVISPRLPTVSLATTSWFMSCFLGNMPIESVLRVWDALFYEGSKTLFRISLAIFKIGEAEICANKEQLEVFQVVQGLPRKLLDVNHLMEVCYKRRNGFGHLSQEVIDSRRRARRRMVRRDRDEQDWERMQKLQEKRARDPIGPGSTQRSRSVAAGKAVATKTDPLAKFSPIPRIMSKFGTSSRHPRHSRDEQTRIRTPDLPLPPLPSSSFLSTRADNHDRLLIDNNRGRSRSRSRNFGRPPSRRREKQDKSN